MNIDDKLRKEITAKMHTDTSDPTIFDNAQSHIFAMLENDSLPRFVCSERYKRYKGTSESIFVSYDAQGKKVPIKERTNSLLKIEMYFTQ